MFVQIVTIYRTLVDFNLRAKYDKHLRLLLSLWKYCNPTITLIIDSFICYRRYNQSFLVAIVCCFNIIILERYLILQTLYYSQNFFMKLFIFNRTF